MSLGTWQTIAWSTGGQNQRTVELKIRPLYVDTKLKEYTAGSPRDITERVFVVRRVFRVNDALPNESRPRWQWEQGGWISVDRTTGRVSSLPLPYFHTFYSTAVWYRDYVAYYGTSEDLSKAYAVVVQLRHRKPVFRQALPSAMIGNEPDSACLAPVWERDPARVTFKVAGGQAVTFSLRPSESGAEAEEEPQTSE